MQLTITNIADLTERIREFRLARPDGAALPGWTPGAHIDVDPGAAGTRSYSLIDWAGERDAPEAYAIAVQREDDGQGGSKAMFGLRAGSELSVTEPKNDFELRSPDAPIYLLAGGIGITPLISMATSLSADRRAFRLLYACRTRDGAAYAERLVSAFPQVTIHPDDTAPLDLSALSAKIRDADGELYICGPRGMIDAARSAAEAAGIRNDRIHVELFVTPDAAPAGDQPFEVEIKDTGQVFTIPPGQTIISVLNAAGIDLIYDCLRGDCGICQVDVIDGIPDHRDVVLTDAEKAKNDVMQICVSRAKSARLVLDI